MRTGRLGAFCRGLVMLPALLVRRMLAKSRQTTGIPAGRLDKAFEQNTIYRTTSDCDHTVRDKLVSMAKVYQCKRATVCLTYVKPCTCTVAGFLRSQFRLNCACML
jgi:hypothetical protein